MNEIINYIMETPGNTNPNVLKGMLEKNNGGSNETIGIIDSSYEPITVIINDGTEEVDIDCFIYENINDNLTKFFYQVTDQPPLFQLKPFEQKAVLLPVKNTDIYDSDNWCLIKEKEFYAYHNDFGEPLIITKDMDGIVPDTGGTPK